MSKRKRIIAEVAKQFVERKIKTPLAPSDLDKFSKHSSHKLRRLFGSFRRAMKIILNEAKNFDEPKKVEPAKPAEVKKPETPAKPKAPTAVKVKTKEGTNDD